MSLIRFQNSSNFFRLTQYSKPVKSDILSLSLLSPLPLISNSVNFAKSSFSSSLVGIPSASRIAFSRLAALKITMPADGSSYSTVMPLLIRAGMWVDNAVSESGLFFRVILPEISVFSTSGVILVIWLLSSSSLVRLARFF